MFSYVGHLEEFLLLNVVVNIVLKRNGCAQRFNISTDTSL